MLDILKIFPPSLVLITIILVILPTIAAIYLRSSLYSYLIDSANKVSRLLLSEQSRGQQPAIVDKLENRFQQASKKLEQVNTIALIDGLYSQEKLNFLGISLRCEQWDYFCQTLPNLLLAFGLLGTFIGISSNLYNLSQTINQNSTDIDNLVMQLQTPLQNMGIAFFTSLIAIACSSILISINVRCNTHFAKSLLISSLEDYLDNIYKIKIQGYSRLDKAVDRMVKQQQEFLERFHEKVGQVLETSMGNAANKMVAANQGFQNNVDSLVTRFQDVSGSLAASTDSFQQAAFTLKEQVEIVTNIVPKFESASNKIESGSNLYLKGAEKIEQSKFSQNLENLTADLSTIQKAFAQSTAFLGNQVVEIVASHKQATELAEQVYMELQTAASKIHDSAVNFSTAAETFKESDFAAQLATATQELITVPKQFNESTAILHKSTDALVRAIDNINISATEITDLARQANEINQNSRKLLATSDKRIELEIIGFDNIQSELNQISETLKKHQEAVNKGLETFGGRLLKTFQQESEENVQQLEILTTETKQFISGIGETKSEINKLTSRLEVYFNNVSTINSQLSEFIKISQKQGEQVINQLTIIPPEIGKIINASKQHEQQMSSEFKTPGNIFTNNALKDIFKNK